MSTLDTPVQPEPDATPLTSEAPVSEGPTGTWRTKPRTWIPRPDDTAAHPNRTLVLCFDGTGDHYDDDNSNVVQLVTLLKKDDHAKQMVYYQTGIGTQSHTDQKIPFLRNASKVLDLMFATTLGYHIRDGYEFLCQNYQEGDVICIFGFSRGAYTARALAGMIQKVGVLPPWNRQMIPFAYHMYSQTDPLTLRLCAGFKSTFSIDVKIEFVGVWDTVASVGLIPRYLPFVGTNNAIRYFRHALALDERRVKFAPSYYKQSRDKDEAVKDEWEAQKANGPAVGQPLDTSATAGKNRPKKPKKELSQGYLYENVVNRDSTQKTDSLEVWFSGAHADVGGGSVPNHTRHSLARIPLRWMIRECFRCHTGLILDAEMLRDEIGMDIDLDALRILEPPTRLSPQPNLPEHRLRPVPLTSQLEEEQPDLKKRNPFDSQQKDVRDPFKGEAAEELLDALSPIYDQLEQAPSWWALEWTPLRVKKQDAIYKGTDGADTFEWLVNRGEGRKVFKFVFHRGMKVHRSVLTRLEALNEKGQAGAYVPSIRPNIVIKKHGKENRLHCRLMTHEEWSTQKVEKLDRPWFEWV